LVTNNKKCFGGLISEIKIYKRELNEKEISLSFDFLSCNFKSGNSKLRDFKKILNLNQAKSKKKFVGNQFKDLLNNEKYSDFIFYFSNNGNKKIHAHKLILESRFEFFKNFFNIGMLDSKNDSMNIEESYDSFLTLLEFAYTGEVDIKKIEKNNFVEILLISNKYGDDELIHIMDEMKFNEEDFKDIDVWALFQCAKDFGMNHLYSQCVSWIIKNLDMKSQETMGKDIYNELMVASKFYPF
jgi:hypothetical protein